MCKFIRRAAWCLLVVFSSAAVLFFRSPVGERVLTRGELAGLYAGTVNNLCCAVKSECIDTQHLCSNSGSSSTCNANDEDEELAGHTKACLTSFPGKTCSVTPESHICRKVYSCIWNQYSTPPKCERGALTNSHSAPNDCTDDC